MTYGFWVPLDRATKEKVLDLARRERRRPDQQARVLIERAVAVEEPLRQTAAAPTFATAPAHSD